MSPKLIGFYGSDDQAQHARQDLYSAGFDGKAIHVYHGAGKADPSEVASAVDRQLQKEAAQRGATAVMLDLDETGAAAERALQILKRHHPKGMARAAWPAHGWQGSMQPQEQQAQAPQKIEQPQSAQPAHKGEVEQIFSAKRFATEMAGDDRFRGREWNDIEVFVRREFERRYPNQSWEEHLPAIMLGYVRAAVPT